MRRSSAIAAFLAILVVPVGVNAAESQVEPHASSPAGSVYEIPLETARRDGAPHRKAKQGGDSQSNSGGGSSGSSGGGAGGGGVLPQGSAVKSENGYGSSSKVPGLDAGDATEAATAQNAAKLAVPDEASDQQAASAQTSAPVDIPSDSASYGLVLMIVLGGAAAGVLAAGAIRRSLGA